MQSFLSGYNLQNIEQTFFCFFVEQPSIYLMANNSKKSSQVRSKLFQMQSQFTSIMNKDLQIIQKNYQKLKRKQDKQKIIEQRKIKQQSTIKLKPKIKLKEVHNDEQFQKIVNYLNKKQSLDQVLEQLQKAIPKKPINSNLQQIPMPQKPLNPYMLFHIEKSSQIKKKKLLAISNSKYSRTHTLNRQKYEQKISDSISIYQQWNQMTQSQKDPYHYEYEKRLRKYNLLYDEYTFLTGRKKILTPYSRFYKQQYGILQLQRRFSLHEISHIINQKWASLSPQERLPFQQEYQQQSLQLQQLPSSLPSLIPLYIAKLSQYDKEQALYRMGILEKYQLVPGQLNKIVQIVTNQRLLRKFQRKKQGERRREKEAKERARVVEDNLKKLREIKDKEMEEIARWGGKAVMKKNEKKTNYKDFKSSKKDTGMTSCSKFMNIKSNQTQHYQQNSSQIYESVELEIKPKDQNQIHAEKQENVFDNTDDKIKDEDQESEKMRPKASTFSKLLIYM